VLRHSANDEAAVATAGVTVFEALKAYELLKSEGVAIRVIDVYSLQPIDAKTLLEAARATGGTIITVEDHYPSGGIGDAVSAAIAVEGHSVHRLAVRDIPRSGQPDELLDRFGLSARHIADAVRASRKAAKA
jgi:transketolase